MAATNVATLTASASISAFGSDTFKKVTLSGTIDQDLSLDPGASVVAVSSDTNVCTAAAPQVTGTNFTVDVTSAGNPGTANVTVSISGGIGGGASKVCAMTVRQEKKIVLERGTDDTTLVQYDANDDYGFNP